MVRRREDDSDSDGVPSITPPPSPGTKENVPRLSNEPARSQVTPPPPVQKLTGVSRRRSASVPSPPILKHPKLQDNPDSVENLSDPKQITKMITDLAHQVTVHGTPQRAYGFLHVSNAVFKVATALNDMQIMVGTCGKCKSFVSMGTSRSDQIQVKAYCIRPTCKLRKANSAALAWLIQQKD